MLNFLSSSSLLLACSVNLNAQSDDILASITQDMQYFNSVATITKQNEHYQPYIISVFKGKELEDLGVSNLKEALQLVPGVDMATDNFNNQTPIFRGSNTQAYGQTKLFIDDVLVNNVFSDSYSEYLGMPIEMIKRIEVVRGPGSKTNGVNAYAGSINIITYAEDFKDFESNDKVVFKYGSYDYRMAEFIKKFQADNFDATIDFYYQEDNKELYAGPDGYSQGSMSGFGHDNTGLSQTGYAPVWMRDYSLGVNLKYYDFTLKGRMLEHTQGSAYGINLSLPQDSDRLKTPTGYIELGYDKTINDFEIDIKAGVKFDTFDSKAKLAPDGLEFIDYYQFSTNPSHPINDVNFTNGMYGEHKARQRTLYQSSYLTYNGFDNHAITTGYRVLQEKTVKMTSKLSNWSTGDAALVDYTETFPFVDKNAKRDTYIFSLQDEFQYSENLSFIYGFNYEATSHKDAGFEPRISMVYQRNYNNIYKAIYSRAHRNPSWQEMYPLNNHSRQGSDELDPEKVDAFELAYVRKFTSDSYLQTNLFYLMNQDQIFNTSFDPVYKNVLDTDLYGVEFEYAGHILSSDKLYLNYSYVDGHSNLKGSSENLDLANVAHHLAKIYYIYNINNTLSLSSVGKYVGSKERMPEDTREKLPAYATLDAALKYKNRMYDFDVSLSVKNIFDATVKYPSAPRTYTEDYLQEGRNFLITLKKEF
ncbi:TonB-dependent receptor plug domain-containing protein [Sulfurimonas sp.]|uniref:TonB-dependent receptor plug domain-containing protein n=4 Tax=Sulfurimonas sp. TaxID=2022749 RepID=UPI003D11A53F